MSSQNLQVIPVPKDQIFAAPRPVEDFHFGKETAAVFDDMLDRSVPYYSEMQRMVGELTADFAAEGTGIWDLGCSTANSFLAAQPYLQNTVKDIHFVGIDNSPQMLDKARQKLEHVGFPYPYELRDGDLNQPMEITNASVALMLLTLQFVRPLHRDRLLKNIYDGLGSNGSLILIEKVHGEDSTFNRLFIKHYYEYKKRNGYSELEIAQKREALENVLIPYRLEENKELLRRTGFRYIDVFFKWYNFCGIIAIK